MRDFAASFFESFFFGGAGFDGGRGSPFSRRGRYDPGARAVETTTMKTPSLAWMITTTTTITRTTMRSTLIYTTFWETNRRRDGAGEAVSAVSGLGV